MESFYEMLGVTRLATPVEVKAAFQARMKALEGSGLPEPQRAAREKMLRQAFITLFDPANKARYDAQLVPPKPRTFVSEPVAPHEVASKSPVLMIGVGVVVVAAIAGGWWYTHPSAERLEQARKEADARNRGGRARLENAPVTKNPNPFRNAPNSETKDRMIKQAVERDAKQAEKEAKEREEKGVVK